MNPQNILLIGDSLIAEGNWPTLLPTMTTSARGIPGETAQELLDRLTHLAPEIMTSDATVIMIGTNNLLMEDYTFPQIISRIIHSIKKLRPDIKLVTCSLFPFQSPWLAPDAIQRLNETTESICRAEQVFFHNLLPSFTASQVKLFQEDGIHLNETGYRVWGKSLSKTIAKYLDEDYC
ncbi:MAG: hypothetical protein H8E79_07280 [Desulfobulbaceae bacterium]|uniref:SGNH hydrolase-type esterase domain-containing protein n=1 Tax=Candidatus Desulfatifera sulfidica TaxID=2841691 RepID=A0A8J6N8Q5_9BACT|nr:hypothetical protein [Candidatus Desulfatifera sulfidica]